MSSRCPRCATTASIGATASTSSGVRSKGLTARAVVVLDENNRVLHSELVPEIANEPNYEAALAALK